MGSAKLAQPLLDDRRIGKDPSIDSTVIHFKAALSERFFQIPVAQRIGQMAGNGLNNGPCLEVPPLEPRVRAAKSSFDWRFNFSAIAFRSIGTLHKSGAGISPLIVNRPVTKRICNKTAMSLGVEIACA